MGRLRLQRPKEQFDYVWEDSVITCNYVTLEERLKLQRRHTKIKNGNDITDWAAYMRDLRDRMIDSWGDSVVDDAGNAQPCTVENKMLIPLEVWNDIVDFNDKAIALRDKAKENSLGN